MVDYRAYIGVPGLPTADEARWEPFGAALEADFGGMGPVLSWGAEGMEVVLSCEADDETAAAEAMAAAVSMSLRNAGLDDLRYRVMAVEAFA
jgi:hypothetical protein